MDVLTGANIDENGRNGVSDTHDSEIAGPSPLEHVRAKVILKKMAVLEAAIIASTAFLASFFYANVVLPLEQPALAYPLLGIILSLIAHVFYVQLGLYEPSVLTDESSARIGELWGGLLMSFLVVLGMLYLCKIAESFSRGWMLLWFLTAAMFVACGRICLLKYTRRLVAEGRLRDPVAIFGSLEFCRQIRRHLETHCPFIEIAGVFIEEQDNYKRISRPTDVEGGLAKLQALSRKGAFDSVVIAFSSEKQEAIRSAVRRLALLPVELHLCTEVAAAPVPVSSVRNLGGLRLDVVMQRPHSERARLSKGLFDYLIATLILVGLAPLFAVIVLAIKMTSRGPILFRQRRYGCNHRTFTVYKFRTMSVMEDGASIQQAQRNDVRVTKVGWFLRRTSLDELPQLFNVLMGQMSIVGPRPHALAHNEHFAKQLELYPLRHRVKPGITGWAQIHGLRGETKTLEDMSKRVDCDLYYIENWSIWLDVEILLRTIFAVLKGRNAY